MNECLKKFNIMRKTRFGLLFISLLIVCIDQITKYIARNNLFLYETKVVIPNFWNWTLAYNKGAAFSLFAHQAGSWPKLFFGVIAFIVSMWLINYLLMKVYTLINGIAFSFILGGAIGNLIDRIVHDQVTDFIDWYYKAYHWPAFNVADSFICLGVTVIIIEGIFLKPKNKLL